MSDNFKPLLSRRHFLSHTAGGLGGVALAWLLARDNARAASSSAKAPIQRPFSGQSKTCGADFLLRRRESSRHV